jgi:hypothetical protein
VPLLQSGLLPSGSFFFAGSNKTSFYFLRLFCPNSNTAAQYNLEQYFYKKTEMDREAVHPFS